MCVAFMRNEPEELVNVFPILSLDTLMVAEQIFVLRAWALYAIARLVYSARQQNIAIAPSALMAWKP